MAEFETGPDTLPHTVMLRQRRLVRSAEILSHQQADFTDIGTFDVIGEGLIGFRETLFSPILLDHKPKFCRLRLSGNGTVLLLDQENNLLRAPILAEDLRIVNIFNSGEGVVGESGYILLKHYRLETRRITHRRLDRILKMADEGIKPPFFSQFTFTKVDKDLVGKTLRVLNFDLMPAWPLINDAVVIDTEDRKLIAREVRKPLDMERWLSQIIGDQYRQIDWIYPFI